MGKKKKDNSKIIKILEVLKSILQFTDAPVLFMVEKILKHYKNETANKDDATLALLDNDNFYNKLETMIEKSLEKQLFNKIEQVLENNKKEVIVITTHLAEDDDLLSSANEILGHILSADSYIEVLREKIDNASKGNINKYAPFMRNLFKQFGNSLNIISELKKAKFKPEDISNFVITYQKGCELFLLGKTSEANKIFTDLCLQIEYSEQINLALAFTQCLENQYQQAYNTLSLIKEKDKYTNEVTDKLASVNKGIQINQVINEKYTILSFLQSGGMGEIYLAKDINDKIFAIKVLKEEFTHDDRFIKRFEKEANLLKTINDPFTVTFYESGKTSGRAYYVMQFIDGLTLQEYLYKNGKLNYKEFYYLAKNLLKTLANIHEQKVIHRDISPANIIIKQSDDIIDRPYKNQIHHITVNEFINQGNPYLIGLFIDFGIGRQEEEIECTITKCSFNRKYAPYEQVTHGQTTTASDYYSLWLSLLETLTYPKHPDKFDAPNFPNSFKIFFEKCIASHPKERLSDYNEIQKSLTDLYINVIAPEDFPQISDLVNNYQKDPNDENTLNLLLELYKSGADLDVIIKILLSKPEYANHQIGIQLIEEIYTNLYIDKAPQETALLPTKGINVDGITRNYMVIKTKYSTETKTYLEQIEKTKENITTLYPNLNEENQKFVDTINKKIEIIEELKKNETIVNNLQIKELTTEVVNQVAQKNDHLEKDNYQQTTKKTLTSNIQEAAMTSYDELKAKIQKIENESIENNKLHKLQEKVTKIEELLKKMTTLLIMKYLLYA